MFTWKEKVRRKLSRILSDSPSSTSRLAQPQARLHSEEGKSFSSIFSFILPSASFDAFRSNEHKHDIKPIQSLPVRWNSWHLSQWGKPLDSHAEYDPDCEKTGASNSHDEDVKQGSGRSMEYKNKGDSGSGRSKNGSDLFGHASDPHNMEKSMPCLSEDSAFISSDLYEFLQSSIPNIVRGCQWVLLYSTIRHGISLRTLIRKSADHSGPCLLIVGDIQGAVFGGLLECPLKPTMKRKYQGTNQAFVFTTLHGEPRIFRPTGVNRYFYLCQNDLLALGGGGNFALCLDGDLLTGASGPCETFGNLCLARDQEFELKNVELWGFTHLSSHIS